MRFRQTSRSGLILLGVAALAYGCNKDATGPILETPTLPEAPVATVLLHETVDSENGGKGVYNFKNFQNWDVVDGCVDLHGNGFHDVLAGNGLYIDLDGTCEKGGTIQSKTNFQLEPGVTYILEFWLAGNQRVKTPDTVTISLGTVFSEQIVLQRRDPFRLHTRQITVPAATQARLRIQNSGGDNQGALLDQVRLRRAE